MTRIEYRPVRVEDFDDLVALWGAFPGTTMTGVDCPDGLSRFLRRNPGLSFVALSSDGEQGDSSPGAPIAGSVLGGHDGRRGYVYHLAVRPDLQNMGIARELMRLLENAMEAEGLEKAHLFVYSDNPAIEFYARTGWLLRQDIVVMSKVLSEDQRS